MILDQWGRQVRWQAAHGAVRYDYSRPWEPVRIADLGKLIPSYDRLTLLSASRRLFINHFMAGALESKAMYAVGRAWNPIFLGTDTEWGKLATEWLLNEWYGICDTKGQMHDFKVSLYLESIAMDRDGECFCLLTQTPNGYPKFQMIPCHRINGGAGLEGQSKVEEPGEYKGMRLVDGIVYDAAGTAVAARYVNENSEFVEYLPFNNLIHLYDPAWQEQGRGLPALTRSINDLRDGLQAHDWERQTQLICSSISLLEHNELGGPDPNDNQTILGQDNKNSPGTGVHTEAYSGGTIQYFKANSGGKLDPLFNPRPGESWEAFQDRMVRATCYALSWPYSYWKPSGQGTAERSEISRAQRSVEDRQDVLEYSGRRKIQYGIAKAIKLGRLPNNPEWYKWTFTKPPKLGIDDGRVIKEWETQYRLGWKNADEMIGMLGSQTSYSDHVSRRAEQIAIRKLAKKAAEEKYGVEIDDREMEMLSPNDKSGEETEAQKGETDAPISTNSD